MKIRSFESQREAYAQFQIKVWKETTIRRKLHRGEYPQWGKIKEGRPGQLSPKKKVCTWLMRKKEESVRDNNRPAVPVYPLIAWGNAQRPGERIS
ncbi:hypothetical protein TNCV_281531 [Trichonephila clavipes]|nr:hypothetical protein TNCV_281531 [Trichonephila clavipes]